MKRAVFIIAFCLSVGCQGEKSVPAGTSKQDREYALNHLDSLYWKYLHDDVKGARAAMIEAIVYTKRSPIPELKNSPLGYWRLSVLELRAGNSEAARMFLERGNRSSNSSKKMTQDECEKIVTQWDNTHLNGGNPRYLESLRHATNHLE